jgi:hypothetical protein
MGKGVRNVVYHLTGVEILNRQERTASSIQGSDLEAMQWIRKNTPMECLIVSDRGVVCELPAYMYYGTFSERQMYLEGDIYLYSTYKSERARRKELIEHVYHNDEDAILTLRNEGVDFIIQTKWITTDFLPSANLCSNVFSNETVNIWKIREVQNE